MTVEQRIDGPGDQFPVGLRVLAVDDDPTSLKLLQTLLLRCHYHVTTTSQARTALSMLREKRNKFDLVISEVLMPDMDGFKLIELVGLEMDLPVILLSANADTNLVMKGISNGACDYLLKPVRIEELKNIWQHVIRWKKFDSKSKQSSGNQDRANGGIGEGYLYQNEGDDGERDENGGSSTQKKPRVVWSVELHRKFVEAVNQLGIDKAVPKKIMDLMNVEKLTRENVASHLQKYRQYLRRISLANQQVNRVLTFGSTDPSYLRTGGPINGHGNFNPFAVPLPFQNQPFRSFPSAAMIGRLHSPGGLVLNQHHGSGASHIGEVSITVDGPTDVKTQANGTSSGLGVAKNMLMLGHCEDAQGGGYFGSQSLKPELCSLIPGPGRFTDDWSSSGSSRVTGNQFDPSSMASFSVPSHGSMADTELFLQSKYQGTAYRPNTISISALDQSLDMKSSLLHSNMDSNSMGKPNYADPLMAKYDGIEKATVVVGLCMTMLFLSLLLLKYIWK